MRVVVRVRRHRSPRARWCQARAGRERAVPARRRAGDGRRARRVHVQRRHARSGGRSRRATSASACTSTSPRAPSTRTPAQRLATHADRRRGCSCTASTSIDALPGTIAHNPRSNMNNAVGYARPAARPNPIVLGTDGIGADMLEEFRLAFVRHREDDVTASPDVAWSWLENGWQLVPEARGDVVTWSYERDGAVAARVHARRAGGRCRGRTARSCSATAVATRVDAGEVRARAAEQARRLFTGCYDRLMATPVALYLQDAHPSREAMGYVQYAGATRLRRGVAGREPARARGDRADGRVRRGDRPDQGRLGRRRHAGPATRPAWRRRSRRSTTSLPAG